MREYQKDFITLYSDFRDEDNRLQKAGKIAYAIQKLELVKPDDICLDLGCSNGIITHMMAEVYPKVVGVDIDMTAMKMVNQNEDPRIKYVYGDAMQLPFADQSFGALICSQTYEHVPSDLQMFAEISRVIKLEGVVYFSGPNKLYPIEPHYYLPFLHWLPEKWANRYLKITGKGDKFYERSRTYWALKKIFKDYQIYDVINYVFEYYAITNPKRFNRELFKILSKFPHSLLQIISPFIINFNWILIKKEVPDHGKQKIKIPG